MSEARKPVKLSGNAKPKKLTDQDEVRRIITDIVRESEKNIFEDMDIKHAAVKDLTDRIMSMIHTHAVLTSRVQGMTDRVEVYNALPFYKKIFTKI